MTNERSAIKRRPEEIKSVIEEILGRLEKTRKADEGGIIAAWENAAGKRAAKHTQPVSLRKGVLTVAVDGSAWLYQLTIDKRKLIDALKAGAGQEIADIQFRIR